MLSMYVVLGPVGDHGHLLMSEKRIIDGAWTCMQAALHDMGQRP